MRWGWRQWRGRLRWRVASRANRWVIRRISNQRPQKQGIWISLKKKLTPSSYSPNPSSSPPKRPLPYYKPPSSTPLTTSLPPNTCPISICSKTSRSSVWKYVMRLWDWFLGSRMWLRYLCTCSTTRRRHWIYWVGSRSRYPYCRSACR